MEKDYEEFESYRDNDNEGFKEMQESIFDAITLVGMGGLIPLPMQSYLELYTYCALSTPR